MIAAIAAAYITELNDPIEGERWANASLDIARGLGARLFESINLEVKNGTCGDKGEFSKLLEIAEKGCIAVNTIKNGLNFKVSY